MSATREPRSGRLAGVAVVAVVVAVVVVGCALVLSGRTPSEATHARAPGHASEVTPMATLYVQADDSVYALRASNRTVLWRYAVGGGLAAPVLAEGVVYDASDALYALDARTGAPRWKRVLDGPPGDTPVVRDGDVYTATGGSQGATGGSIYALRASDGAILWRYATGGDNIWSSPAVSGGVVYVASDDEVYALRASDGTPLWRYRTSACGGAFMGAAPAVAGGVVYAGSASRYLYALDAGSGKPLSRYDVGAPINATPVVAGGIVYAGEMSASLTALRAGDGAVLWRFTAGATIRGSPVVAGNVVYVGSQDGEVYALDAGSGTVRWRRATAGTPYGLLLAGGALYVQAAMPSGLVDVYPLGYLDALDPATGAPLWRYHPSEGEISLPAIG